MLRLRREEGQSLPEYGLLLVLIAIILVVGLGPLGEKLQNIFCDVVSHLSSPSQVNGGCVPDIEFTYVPPYGNRQEDLRGRVRNVDPASYKVAVYIYIPGRGWWTKPYWATPSTPIQPDGAWTADIATGGIDEQATRIKAYLAPGSYDVPLMRGGETLPPELERNSVASVMEERQ
jgi:Flp pilus assembly pilin Flp